MALPGDLYSVAVTGAFKDASGIALSGVVSFTPSAVLTDSTGSVVIPAAAKPFTVTGGTLTTTALVATDNADLLPAGWTYLVTVSLTNLRPYSYNVLIPAAPLTFTATNATPCVFTAAGSAYGNGAAVVLTSGSVPAGFTAGVTYYVVSASGTSFSLAATSGGGAIASTGTGSGFVSTASTDISALQPVVPQGTPVAYVPTTGGTYSGTVVLDGSPALQIPGGAASGQVLTSDSSGNATWAAPALVVKPSVQEATAAALPANAYVSGVLTASSNGALTVDGIAVSLADRVLVKNEVTAANNGIYTVTAIGSGGAKYVLTRSADMNTGVDVPGAFAFIERGSINAGQGYMVTGAGAFTIGSTAINWTQFSAAAAAVLLVPTAVKTSAYTANPADFVLCDTQTTGAFTVTLPTAPADKTTIGVKMVKQTSPNVVTIARGGSDTFNDDASTSASLSLLNQGAVFQYDAALTAWIKISSDMPLAQLDARYFQQSQTWTEVNNTGEMLWSLQPSGGTDTVSPFNMSIGAATFGGVVGPQLQFGYNVSPGTPGGSQNTNGSMYLNFFGDAGDTNSSGAHGIEANIAFRTPGSTASSVVFQAVAVNDTTNTVNTHLNCGTGSSGSIQSGIAIGNTSLTALLWSAITNTLTSQATVVSFTGTGVASSGTQFNVSASGTTSNAILSVISASSNSYLQINGSSSAGVASLRFQHAGTSNWEFYTDATNLDLRLYDDINGAIALDLFAGSTNVARKFQVNATLQVVGASAVIGSGALATTATDGFLYLDSCAGPPTGVPTTKTGTVAMVYDSTNNNLYAYNGGWKKTTTFA